MTKYQKSIKIYNDLIDVFKNFNVDITSPGIEAVVKGSIHSTLEKIEEDEKTTNQ